MIRPNGARGTGGELWSPRDPAGRSISCRLQLIKNGLRDDHLSRLEPLRKVPLGAAYRRSQALSGALHRRLPSEAGTRCRSSCSVNLRRSIRMHRPIRQNGTKPREIQSRTVIGWTDKKTAASRQEIQRRSFDIANPAALISRFSFFL